MPQTDDRSVTSVLQDILSNVQEIVRSEVRLAKAEIKVETGKAARAWKPLIAGGVLMLYSGGLLMLAAVYGLSLVLEPWLAALAVCIVVGLIATALIQTARTRLKRVNPIPEKTMESVRENVQWLKNQTR